jgi:hypothetical protein
MVFHLHLQQTKKATATNKCTSVAGHFNGHASTLKQYTWHCLIKQILGHTRCPWTLPLVDYSLHIAPLAVLPRQQANRWRWKNTSTLLAVLMAIAMRRYVTVCIPQWRRSRASLEATARLLWASIMSNNIKGTYLCHFFMFFIVNALKMGAKQKDGPN